MGGDSAVIEDESFEEMAASYSFCSLCMNAMEGVGACIEGEDCECECHLVSLGYWFEWEDDNG